MRRFTRPPALLRSTSLESRSELPKRPGVYYVIQWHKPWKVLYVGMSGNMRTRWTVTGKRRQHHQLKRIQYLSNVRIHYRVTRTRKMAQRLEAIDIRRHKPILNGRYEYLEDSIQRKFLDFVDIVDDIGIAIAILGVAWLLLRWCGT